MPHMETFIMTFLIGMHKLLLDNISENLSSLCIKRMLILTINLWIKQRATIFVSFMTRHIPELNKEISLGITFDAIRRATWVTISNVLYEKSKDSVKTRKTAIALRNCLMETKGLLSFTFTPTVQPTVWGGLAIKEPFTIRWTRELFPTPKADKDLHNIQTKLPSQPSIIKSSEDIDTLFALLNTKLRIVN